MAPNRFFPATDKIVYVSCKDADMEVFSVHERLVRNNAGLLQIDYDATGRPSAEIDASFSVIEFFTQWLYHRMGFEDFVGCSKDFDHDALIAGLEAHAMGEAVGCFDFMNMILDGIIDGLSANDTVCSTLLIKAFADRFAIKSRGTKLAIDILLHTHREDCKTDCADVFDLNYVNDQAFINELARAILSLKGYNTPEDISKPDYCRMVVVGFLKAQPRDGPETQSPPWLQDRCQYHRHTELALPCYKPTMEPNEVVPLPIAGHHEPVSISIESDDEE